MTRGKRLGRTLWIFAFAGLASARAGAAPQALAGLSVTNSLDAARPDEVVDLPLADVLAHAPGAAPQALVVRDADSGADLVTQPIDESGAGAPDHLLILANMAPRQTRHLQFFSIPNQPAFPSRVYARFAPERKDDFAWENDRIAFRVYGPALQATGEVSSGVDVWSKRVPQLILDQWYTRADEAAQHGAEGVHSDHGTGLDCYKVEPSRGCGGTAVWDNGQFDVSQNYTSYKILANGPIRTMFELTFAPWNAGGVQVGEVKRISLDAGSHLNRFQSTFRFSGADTLKIAAAVVIHTGGVLQTPAGHEYVSEWEPGDKPATDTHNATALVAVPGTDPQYEEALGHGIYVYTVKPAQPITYYAGAGWSRYDVASQGAWETYLAGFAARLKSPLTLQWDR